jgi:nucleoside-diphosphate-sugar epimerase
VIGQDFFFSHARARRDLGYAPIVEPGEAEARTIAWLRTQRI